MFGLCTHLSNVTLLFGEMNCLGCWSCGFGGTGSKSSTGGDRLSGYNHNIVACLATARAFLTPYSHWEVNTELSVRYQSNLKSIISATERQTGALVLELDLFSMITYHMLLTNPCGYRTVWRFTSERVTGSIVWNFSHLDFAMLCMAFAYVLLSCPYG
jgi:hypothetical protein